MFNSIVNALNLKDEDIESIESIFPFRNEDFLITLNLKDHICPHCGSITCSVKEYSIRTIHHKIFIQFDSVIYYRVHRYKCNSCGRSFVEENPFGSRRRKITLALVILYYKIIFCNTNYIHFSLYIPIKFNYSIT